MDNAIDLLKVFNQFLLPTANTPRINRFKELENYIHTNYDNKLIKLTKVLNSKIEEENIINDILTRLKIKESEKSKYRGLNLSQFLAVLSKNSLEAEFFLLSLQRKEAFEIIKLIVYLGLGSMIFFLVPQITTYALKLFAEITHTVLVASIAGLIFTVSATVYYLYSNFTDPKKSMLERYQQATFILANGIFNFISNVFNFVRFLAKSPLVAGFIFIAKFIDLIKETVSLGKLIYEYRNELKLNSALANDRNHKLKFQMNRNVLLINILTASLLVAIAIATLIVPGGSIMTVAAFAASALVYGIKIALLDINAKIFRNKLLNTSSEHQGENSNGLKLGQETVDNQVPTAIESTSNSEAAKPKSTIASKLIFFSPKPLPANDSNSSFRPRDFDF